jgi:hypothetical protein
MNDGWPLSLNTHPFHACVYIIFFHNIDIIIILILFSLSLSLSLSLSRLSNSLSDNLKAHVHMSTDGDV